MYNFVLGRALGLYGVSHRCGGHRTERAVCSDLPHLPQSGQLTVPCNVQSCASLLCDLPIKIAVRVGELNI